MRLKKYGNKIFTIIVVVTAKNALWDWDDGLGELLYD